MEWCSLEENLSYGLLKRSQDILAEKAMAAHSSTLAWKIPWMEEPGRLQSIGSRRVGHDWASSLSLFTFMHWRRKWQPTPVCSCQENPRDGGALWATVYGVAQSWTRLKRLRSSSSSSSIQTSAFAVWRKEVVIKEFKFFNMVIFTFEILFFVLSQISLKC